jgi:hypothetical protein
MGRQRYITGSKQWLSGYRTLVAQLHPRSRPLFPDEIRYASNLRLWWKCPEGPDHEWQQKVCARTGGSGCPYCAHRKLSITNCLATVYPEIAKQWHPTRNGTKTPRDVIAGTAARVWWRCPRGEDHEWEERVSKRTFDNTGCPFCAGYRCSSTNSLASLFPELALQWHPTKNGKHSPSSVVAGSTRRVWWRCPVARDHVWEASLHDRTACGNGCPFCAGVDVSQTNSLACVAPELLDEWDAVRNRALAPQTIVARSKRKVWWRCPVASDHRWQASPLERAIRGVGCPFCGNRRAARSNSLARIAPAVARLWHPTKNRPLTPQTVPAGGAATYYWQCPRVKGHVWTATIGRRIRAKKDCPFCRAA